MAKEKSTTADVSVWLSFIGAGSLLAGLSVLGYQIYNWFRTGEWASYSLIWLLSQVNDLEVWAYYPTDWIGLHKLLDNFPFPLFLVLIGIILFFIAASWSD